MKSFNDRRNVMKFRIYGDSTSSSIQNKLQMLSLSRRKIQLKIIEQ
jgi:hypothetical protein